MAELISREQKLQRIIEIEHLLNDVEDLDVLLELCDRIMVINSGKITGIVDAETTTKEEIGLLMTKTDSGKENS